MRLDVAQKAASLLERISQLEEVILKLERIKDHGKSFRLSTYLPDPKHGVEEVVLELLEDKLATEVFQQNILEYAVDNLNVELNELREELEELK